MLKTQQTKNVFFENCSIRKNEVRDKAVQIKKKEFFGSELFQFFSEVCTVHY
jgi:hypothetical protein